MTWYDIIWYDMIWYTHIYIHMERMDQLLAWASSVSACPSPVHVNAVILINIVIYIHNSKFDLEHILLSLLISASSGCSFLPLAWWGGRERGAPRTRAQKTITQANIAILSLQLKSWPSMNPWSLLPIVYPVLPFGRTALASMCLAREDCRSGASFMGVWLWDAMGCYGIVCQSRGDCSLMQFETWRNTTAIGAFELLWLFYPSWWLSSASWRA